MDIREWHQYGDTEVRLRIPDRYLPEWERHGPPEDLHPDLYPELFEFREGTP